MKTLSNLMVGDRAKVLSIRPEGPVGQRLMCLGLLPGMELNVVQVAPLGDPIAVEFCGQRISLRRAEARGVEVEMAS